MKIRTGALTVVTLLGLAACANVEAPPAPRQGAIPASAGGAAGYQHGLEGSKFLVGEHARRAVQYGYLKQIGDQGTFAIRQSNGSAFGVPNADADSLRMSPYGTSPRDHDVFVRGYFLAAGLPADQVGGVRGMTLLEADGRSNQTTSPTPRITAYYTVIDRALDGVPVVDSFAWARADSEGRIVQEGVYWPALPAAVVAEAGRFKDMLAAPERRRAFESRLPADASAGTVVIRHAAATEDQFAAFASYDVTVRVAPPAPRPGEAIRSSQGGVVLVRHFDLNGKERFLPQETLQLQDQYPERKPEEQ